MDTEYIADAYIDGGLTGGMRGLLPSETIDFRGGHTKVRSMDVLYALLRQPNLEIHPQYRYKDSYPDWLTHCPYNHPAQARIVLEDGYVLSPENDYTRINIEDWELEDDDPFATEETPKPTRTRRVRQLSAP